MEEDSPPKERKEKRKKDKAEKKRHKKEKKERKEKRYAVLACALGSVAGLAERAVKYTCAVVSPADTICKVICTSSPYWQCLQ